MDNFDNTTNTGMYRPGQQPGNLGNQQIAQPPAGQPPSATGEFYRWHPLTLEIELYQQGRGPFSPVRYKVAENATWVKNQRAGAQFFTSGDKCECFDDPITIIIFMGGQYVYA